MDLTAETEMVVMLANDIVNIYLEPECICEPQNEIVKLMRLAVTTMLCNYKELFDDVTNVVSVKPWTVDTSLLTGIDIFFEDEIILWSRIITLYTLVARLTISCKDEEIQCRAKDIGNLVADYIKKDKIHSWIIQNGGWNGFKSSFPVVDEGVDEDEDEVNLRVLYLVRHIGR